MIREYIWNFIGRNKCFSIACILGMLFSDGLTLGITSLIVLGVIADEYRNSPRQ